MGIINNNRDIEQCLFAVWVCGVGVCSSVLSHVPITKGTNNHSDEGDKLIRMFARHIPEVNKFNVVY